MCVCAVDSLLLMAVAFPRAAVNTESVNAGPPPPGEIKGRYLLTSGHNISAHQVMHKLILGVFVNSVHVYVVLTQ